MGTFLRRICEHIVRVPFPQVAEHGARFVVAAAWCSVALERHLVKRSRMQGTLSYGSEFDGVVKGWR